MIIVFRYIIIVNTLLFCSLGLYAQTPTATFNVQSPVCKGEQLKLQNNSLNAQSYSWDFCWKDLSTTPVINSTFNVALASNGYGTQLLYANGSYYGFVVSLGNNKLLRLDYGSSIANTPTVVDLGSIGVLNSPKGIMIFQEGANWYGIIGNSVGTVYRLSFGSLLSNVPTAVTLTGLTGLTDLRQIITTIEGSNRIVAIAGGGASGVVTILNFGSSILNSPQQINRSISGGVSLTGLSIVKEGTNWYGITTGYSSGVYKLSFGNSLLNPVTVSTIAGISAPSGVGVETDGNNYYGFVATDGNFIRINFGSSMSNNTPTTTSISGLGLTTNYGFTLQRIGGNIVGMGINFSSKDLKLLTFPGSLCSVNQSTSSGSTPANINYSQAGTYTIKLTAIHSNGNTNSQTNTVVVNNTDAPQISIATNSNECINSVKTYSGEILNGQTISQWNWDYGDGNTGVGQNTTHQYSTAGIYKVTLTTLSINSCSNNYSRQDTIYGITNPNFSIPGGTLCSNSTLTFSNTSTGEIGSKVKWLWEYIRVSDNQVIGTSSLSTGQFNFIQPGDYKVRLKGGVTGCNSVIEKPITIIDGPLTSFSYTNNCNGQPVQFTNSSTGSNIVSQTWEIRNSSNSLIYSSSNSNISYSFPSQGNYSVQLSVTNLPGCSNSLTKTVYVQTSKTDFASPTAIENVPSAFTGIDLTAADDDIVSYTWIFLDETKIGQVVNHTFKTPGTEIVKLKIITTQGCTEEISKNVTINVSTNSTASFTAKSPVCKGEQLTLQNNSINAQSYSWDFCWKDLSTTPVINSTFNVALASNGYGTQLLYANGSYYGFVVSLGNNKLLRLDYGSSIANTPTVVDLGSIGVLNSPKGIMIFQEGANWYGIIGNSVGTVYRLSFGSLLSNVPTAVTLTGLTGLTDLRQIITTIEGSNRIVAIAGGGASGVVTILNFGSSILNSPQQINRSISGGVFMTGLSLIKEGTNWYGLASGYNTGVYKLSFGNSLLNPITVSTIAGISTPSGVGVETDGNNYYGFVATDGNFIRINFGSSMSNNTPTTTSIPGLGLSINYGFTLQRVGGNVVGIGINFGSNAVKLMTFPGSLCSVNQSTSSGSTPANINYSQAGTYTIKLTAIHSNGNTNSQTNTVVVNNTDAPQIGIATNNNKCINSVKTYSGEILNGQTIALWNWDYGDGNTGIGQNVSHSYALPGTYMVKLQVLNSNGCNNFITTAITIYDETAPDFSFPTGVICSDALIAFTNTSTRETGMPVKWLWDFGDGKTDTIKTPSHIYENGGSYNVKLTAGALGCSNFISKFITVVQGPKTGFKYQNVCLGETTIFNDTTIGNGLTNWFWDFGDGNTSTLQSPVNTYTANGNYNVSLKVKNSNGCEIEKIQPLKINDLPNVNIKQRTLICHGDSLEFEDSSSLSDGNLASWKWQLLSEQGVLIHEKFGKDIKIFFPSPGKYSVILIVTSEAGCIQSTTKNYDVLKSPEIDLSITNTCLGDSTSLVGVSKVVGQNITGWNWEINDGFTNYFIQNPKHKFTAAGKYTIILTAEASNKCPTSIVKEVTIYQKPVADFTFTNNCLNAPVQFIDSSKVAGSSIVDWAWDFNGLGNSNLQNPKFSFSKLGRDTISLTVTSAQGCTQTLRKVITIQDLPIANFSFEPEVGPPPFDVQFNNSSTAAIKYFWDFGDGKTSTLKSPKYTYNELGIYTLNMIAFNSYGCSDTLSRTIRVMPPTLTIVLERILVSTLTEEVTFAVEILNTGSRIIKDIEFEIDFGGQLSFKENWTGILNPNDKFTYPIRTQLIKSQLTKVKYLCINAEEINDEALTNGEIKVCVNLEKKFLVFEPNPNPTTRYVAFSYTLPMLPERNSFEINFYNTRGQKIKFTPQSNNQGFNEIILDISSLQPGLYMVEFIYNRERIKKKILIY